MLSLGPLAFANPWLLTLLAALPAIYWLLKITPPAARRQRFPAIRLLVGLEPQEQTPAQTPPWLLILRLFVAGLLIIALSDPRLDPDERLLGSGPVLLVIDDGWAAAKNWQKRQEQALAIANRAERDGRAMALLTTAPQALSTPSVQGLMLPRELRALIQTLEPKPWPTDRSAALKALEDIQYEGAVNVFWLSDGLIGDGLSSLKNAAPKDLAMQAQDPKKAVKAFMERLQRMGRLELFTDSPEDSPLLLLSSVGGDQTLNFWVQKHPKAASDSLIQPSQSDQGANHRRLKAFSEDGRVLARQKIEFAEGKAEASVKLDLPTEMMNRLERVEIETESHAGAVLLLDERWRRRPVGIVTDQPLDRGQLLLDETFYVDRALQKTAELRRGPVEDLLKRQISVLVLPDSQPLDEVERGLLRQWVQEGGVLIRFAGSLLARESADRLSYTLSLEERLLPVKLRSGDRYLGGAMSWEQAVPLAAFPEESPFAGLIPPREVTVKQQVLAEPSPELSQLSWAHLTDGTPLVTGKRQGQGWLILFHSSANNSWTNLPMSGLFVEMLQRLVGLSRGIAVDQGLEIMAPLASMNGFGTLEAPFTGAQAIASKDMEHQAVGPSFPPGLYGAGDIRQALNLSDALRMQRKASDDFYLSASLLEDTHIHVMRPITEIPKSVLQKLYDQTTEQALKPWIFSLALILAFVDAFLSLWMRGLFNLRRVRSVSLVVFISGGVFWGHGIITSMPQAHAQTQSLGNTTETALSDLEDRHRRASLETRLGYILTGQRQLDDLSRQGLEGLTSTLRRRTAVEAANPMGVDPNRDLLLFYPLIYWPIDPAQPALSEKAVRNLNSYMRSGGVLLIDTRDQGRVILESVRGEIVGPGQQKLRELAKVLDIPPLEQVPENHVLTRSFYLLQDFPGRLKGGALWISNARDDSRDGVSPILITSNDFASAWAMDANRVPLYPMLSGGERQREMALRSGINMVMFALTGNYKSDQIHVPAILERLGQ